MGHVPAAHSRSAQHPDRGSHRLRRKNAGQHVVVIRYHHVPRGRLLDRQTEKIHDKGGVHHLFGRPPVTASQRVEKVDAMPSCQSMRNAREPGAELKTLLSSMKSDATIIITPGSTCVTFPDRSDALITRSHRYPLVPSRIQPQPHSEPRVARDCLQVVRYDAFDVPERRLGGGARPFVFQFGARSDHRGVPVNEADGRIKPQVGHFRSVAYNPPSRPAATSTASGSGVKSSPGLMKRFRSSPYCLS